MNNISSTVHIKGTANHNTLTNKDMNNPKKQCKGKMNQKEYVKDW